MQQQRRSIGVRACVACFFATCSLTAGAGNLVEIDLIGEPQSFVENGKTTGCGIRILGAEGAPEHSGVQRVIDASVAVVPAGKGLVKVSSGYVSFTGARGALTQQPTKAMSGWIRASPARATSPTNGIVQASDQSPFAVLYQATFDSTFAVIAAVMQQRTVQIAVHTVEDTGDRIYFGIPKITPGELSQLNQCLTEIATQ